MTSLFQLFGAVAIVVSLVGTWLAAQHRSGWLLCVISSSMWFPALISGNQWAAVANCVLSIAICTRNFSAQPPSGGRDGGPRDRERTPVEPATRPVPVSAG